MPKEPLLFSMGLTVFNRLRDEAYEYGCSGEARLRQGVPDTAVHNRTLPRVECGQNSAWCGEVKTKEK